MSLDLEPEDSTSRPSSSYTHPAAASGQYPDDWWSEYWVQSCTYKGVTLRMQRSSRGSTGAASSQAIERSGSELLDTRRSHEFVAMSIIGPFDSHC